jgi:ankyrin repeat protein
MFTEAALSDLRRAEEMLSANPQIAGAGLYAALVLGDSKRVEGALRKTPSLAVSRGGPRNLAPLVYVCFSLFAGRRSSRASHLVETARVLLRHGADPNAFLSAANWPDNPLYCLYGSTGLNNNPALGLLLFEVGASPNDSESLYHSTEHADLECTRLLLKYGAKPTGTNALKHMLDREDMEGAQLLLAAGADPNEVNDRGETALHWAVWRGRSAALVATLLDHGADLEAYRKDGRTAYALARHSGQTEVAALLEARGAVTELSALDRFLAEFDRAPTARLDPATLVGSERLLPDFASSHRTMAVRALLDAGMPVDARGENGGTALHWACWKGYADLVELLLQHGASLTVEDDQFHATPRGWLEHGTQNCGEGGDYCKVAALLEHLSD